MAQVIDEDSTVVEDGTEIIVTDDNGTVTSGVNTEPSDVVAEADIGWYGSGASDGYISSADLDEELLNYAEGRGSYSLGYDINGNATNDESRTAQAITSQITGIFGIPYQFSKIVDPQIYKENSSEETMQVGRTYTEKILSVMPVLFLTPGEPVFMPDSGKAAKASIAQRLAASVSNDDSSEDVTNADQGRYYSFNSNFPEYKYYVNTSLRALAYYMGISDCEIPIPGNTDGKMVELGNIDIEDFLNNEFSKMLGTNIAVPFYLDAETSISESFTNETTESQFAQTANSLSSTVKEVQFLLGSKDMGGLAGSIKDALSGLGTTLTESVDGLFDGLSEAFVGKTMLSKISNQLSTVISGGKLVFPKIWSDSDYSKTYTISIKLRSPDPDPVSIFLNIYMPIILLINMAAPRQIGNSPTSYESPFLVRATYRSVFNCDLGIISSMNITKGDKNRWNVMGMPMTANVDISIEDLYHKMLVSKRMGLMTNTAELDYLATMAGIELNEFETLRNIKLELMILGDVFRDVGDNIWGKAKRGVAKFILNRISGIADIRYQ